MSASWSSRVSPSASRVSSGTCVSPPPRFEPLPVAPLVGDEGLQAREQVAAEAPARRLVAREPALLECSREEALGQVLGFLRAHAKASAHVPVDRTPVGRHHGLEGALPLGRVGAAHRQHQGAVRLGEGHRRSPQESAKSSVACTSSLRIPGSFMLWPESRTITSFDFGQRLCSAQALAAGHTTS